LCQDEGIVQSFTLPTSHKQNGIVERRIGMIMELNLWSLVSLPKTSPTLRWTGEVGDASVFWVWGVLSLVRDAKASKLSSCTLRCVDSPPLVEPLEISSDSSGPTEGGDPAADDTAATPRSPRLDTPPSFPPWPSSPPLQPATVDSRAETAGAEPGGAETEGEGSGAAATGGANCGGAATGGVDSGGVASPSGGGACGPGGGGYGHVGAGAASPGGAGGTAGGTRGAAGAGGTGVASLGGTGGAAGTGGARATSPRGAHTGGAGAAGAGGTAGAGGAGGTARSAGGAAGVGGTGAASPGGATGAGGAGGAGAAGVGGARGAGATSAGGAACAGGTGAANAGGTTNAGGAGGGASAGGAGATSVGGTAGSRGAGPAAALRHLLGLPPTPTEFPVAGTTPPLLLRQLLTHSPLPAPAPYNDVTDSLTGRREPETRASTPKHREPETRVSVPTHVRRVRRPRALAVPGTHDMTLRPSSVPQRVVLPTPPASSLLHVADPPPDLARASSPTVTRLLATVVTDPTFSSHAVFALVAELVDFAAARRLDYLASLVTDPDPTCPLSVGGEVALGCDVLEDRQEELECLAASAPHLATMLLAPEGDPDALDIPNPRSYIEKISGEYSSQWQTAMDVEMVSWKSTSTYIDEVPLPGMNIISGIWIFRVKRPPGSPPIFKARYVAQSFNQREGVDFFQTFSPTPKMTTLRVLLHVAAQRDYDLHSLDF
ncbi:unnamed protein product, partial [Closterium sp. NIES-54]